MFRLRPKVHKKSVYIHINADTSNFDIDGSVCLGHLQLFEWNLDSRLRYFRVHLAVSDVYFVLDGVVGNQAK